MKRLAAFVLLVSCSAPPPTPEEDYQQALELRDNPRALELMNRAIAAAPRAEYLLLRALLNLSLKQTDAALSDYGAAAALRPEDATIRVNRALLLIRLGRTKEAEADFGEAIRLLPAYTEAWLQRARLRRAAGRAREADEDIEQARRHGAALADGFYNEGVRALGAGESAEAERMFTFAIELDPDHARAHVAMARMHMERQRYAEAAAELDLAIPAHPRSPELYYHRGTARLAAGRGEEALADYNKAVELDPSEPAYLAARGAAEFRARRDADRAHQDFAAAIQLDRTCYAAWFNRGMMLHDLKELEAAERDLREAGKLRASPEGSLALGRVLHDRGNYDTALSLYRQARELYKAADVQKALRDEEERTRRAKENRK